ncbi:MAG: hypothetical protein AUG17_04250 [Crenarchaeota archaeon 13_1_20CM_2_53_14]|nr:MAG: hypothetical protein AUI07_09715 [archaeon 13_2_20CM_2_53_6]OLE59092.1 MAG: hypothetical protein AUG17_04250 [Crenarchaeota archaeon 13_1_20CM_2_53_14]
MTAGDGRSYPSFTARSVFMVSWFGGQYIAMVDGRVVAHGRDEKKVHDRARHVHPKGRIFLGQAPTRQAMVQFLNSNAGLPC